MKTHLRVAGRGEVIAVSSKVILRRQQKLREEHLPFHETLPLAGLCFILYTVIAPSDQENPSYQLLMSPCFAPALRGIWMPFKEELVLLSR